MAKEVVVETKNKIQTNAPRVNMPDDEREKLMRELEEIAKKYDLFNVGFCGDRDGTFVGFLIRQNPVLSAATNIGRLWQWAREQARDFYDQFERRPRA